MTCCWCRCSQPATMAIRTWRIIAVPQVGGMTKSFGPVYTQPDNLNEIETSEIFNHTGWSFSVHGEKKVDLHLPRRAQVRCEKRCLEHGQGICGGTGRLNGARRRLVVFELVIDLQPGALGVGDDEPTVVVIEDERGGVGESP